MINVSKTYLPDFDKYTEILKRAWDKSWITNNGELVKELEQKLKEYLKVKHLFYCTNGTVVLQMALKALNITQEVITTPFSYVATVNSILWEGGKPIFVDIDPKTCCIDPLKIEAAITEKTQAILATHVYGIPCSVDIIQEIATKHKLKVIYDGAHAFGSSYRNQSLLSYGDVSTCSFHATKLFHTVEGGCIITNDDEIAQKLMLYRQFGHVYEDYYIAGINAKNSEFHAAMGLCVFDDLDIILASRKQVFTWYKQLLSDKTLQYPILDDVNFSWNYSYFPVILNSEEHLINVIAKLKKDEIFPRRYFYPSLNTLPFVNGKKCSVSEDIAKRILCLPCYYGLSRMDVEKISSFINDVIC